MVNQVNTVRDFHIVISGFLQYEGKPNGMIRLWRELHERHSGPDTFVLMRTWNDNMDTLAELIWRLAADNVRVKIYGYSWGGAASVRLARQLQKRGIDVEAMVLSDAVYRHPYWLGNWRALIPLSKIVIPRNVKYVYWFCQKDSWWKISGHEVIAHSQVNTTVISHGVAHVSHEYMDDLNAFHNASYHVAKSDGNTR